MSLTSYLFFVRKRMSSTKMTVYSILVTTIGLTLFLFAVVFSKILGSGRESIMRCISGDIDRYAVSWIDNNTFFDRDIGNAVYQDIMDSEKIESFGLWDIIFLEIESAKYGDVDYMLEEIAVLELISLGVAGVVTFFYEIFFRSLSEWVSILAKGMLIAVIVIVSITVIYVLSQIVWVLRSQPVDVLRNSE